VITFLPLEIGDAEKGLRGLFFIEIQIKENHSFLDILSWNKGIF
jgi:hypothetical protein